MTHAFWVAVKGLIVNPENEILILSKPNEEDNEKIEYDIPWWKLEFWEKLEDGLKREIQEELWIEVKVGRPTRTWWFTKNNFHMVWVTLFARYLWWEINMRNKQWEYEWKTKQEIYKWAYPQWLKNEVRKVYTLKSRVE